MCFHFICKQVLHSPHLYKYLGKTLRWCVHCTSGALRCARVKPSLTFYCCGTQDWTQHTKRAEETKHVAARQCATEKEQKRRKCDEKQIFNSWNSSERTRNDCIRETAMIWCSIKLEILRKPHYLFFFAECSHLIFFVDARRKWYKITSKHLPAHLSHLSPSLDWPLVDALIYRNIIFIKTQQIEWRLVSVRAGMRQWWEKYDEP